MDAKYIGMYSSATSKNTIKYADIYYRHAYEGLFRELIELKCTPVLVYDQVNNYLGDGVFNGYWRVFLDNDDEVQFKHFDDKIKLAFIFDKSRFLANDVAVSDPAEVREICRDKYLSYLFAPELHPESFLLENSAQLGALKLGWKDDMIALKELDSNGGKKVFVGKTGNYDDSLKFPLLAQRYIDTSVGVPGICEGEHDLRVILYNGEVISLLLRRPPKDGHKSNIAYGGDYDELDIAIVPDELRKISHDIDERFQTQKDRFYSIDFANTKDGWRIFELNAWPGLGYETDNEKLYTKRLAKCLVGSLDRQLAKGAQNE
jgi:hypothetical protein